MSNNEMFERRKRLTHDAPEGNYEALHNTAFIKDREVYLRGAGEKGEDITLCEYCAKECAARCENDLSGIAADEFGEYMDCDCPICYLYAIAVGAAEMRTKLFRYEEAGDSKATNKVYFFDDGHRDYGLFIAARTWKEARKISLEGDYDMLAHISFPEIQGTLLRDADGKPYKTSLRGALELYQLDELGIPYRTEY